MSYDVKCYELAEYFLPWHATEERKMELAQLIQELCEEYCQELEGDK